jgi:eukaryotic-like serine/threonine-protein kinase
VPPVSPARISLPDRYRVVRHVASGGMAGVWEAEDQMLGRSVAVKVLAGHLAEDDRARRRFEREARAAAGLSSHPHVVTIYDVGEHDGRVFMVMELMRGGTVGDRLKAGRAISDDTVLRWLREAASALDAAHEAGVVHRDIKPANLLLDERDRLAIADFGIARLAMEDQLTATGQVLGTAAYISPEQAVGDPATPASDRYALAVVAFELLTGTKPFEAEHFAAQARAHVEDVPPPATMRDPSLPRGVDPVLERGMDKDPAARWPSAGAMVDELDRAMGAAASTTEPTRPIAVAAPPTRVASGATAPPPSGPPPARRGDGAAGSPSRRSGVPILAGLAGLLLLAVLGFVLLSGGNNGRSDGGNQASTQQNKPRKKSTPTPTPKAKDTPTPTPTATSTPTPTPTQAPTSAPTSGPNLARARQLQLAGFNARKSGDYESALSSSVQALKACGDAHALDPCGYALFEIGADLNALGRNSEAIPYLERRLNEYGDNSSGEVQAELDKARGGKHGNGKAKGHDKGD